MTHTGTERLNWLDRARQIQIFHGSESVHMRVNYSPDGSVADYCGANLREAVD